MTSPTPKLTIELVPRTCWFSNVRSEVTRQQWDEIKRVVAGMAGNRCQVCGGRGKDWPVECHEIWFYDDVQKIQRLHGLIALCPPCHRVKHFGHSQLKGLARQALGHLSAVNRWSTREAQDYVDQAFSTWELRSHHKWRLDLSFLEFVFGIVVKKGVKQDG